MNITAKMQLFVRIGINEVSSGGWLLRVAGQLLSIEMNKKK